jgi:molybdopterin-guanine dinucleotide biosynthesis protein A
MLCGGFSKMGANKFLIELTFLIKPLIPVLIDLLKQIEANQNGSTEEEDDTVYMDTNGRIVSFEFYKKKKRLA